MDGEANSATLGWLASQGAKVHFACARRVYVDGDLPGEVFELHTLKRHYGLTVSATEAVARWGAATRLDALGRAARCVICGGQGARVHVSAPLSAESIRADLGPPPGEA
jgi:hypothetical protein